MPPAKKPPSDTALARAAELRAAGATWEAVAAKLRRPADAVRRWPLAHPDRWHNALRDAERRLVAEAGAESVLILRQLLRSDDEKIRRDAARFLIDLRVELTKLERRVGADGATAESSDARRLVAFLEARSDEEVAELAREFGVDAGADGRGDD